MLVSCAFLVLGVAPSSTAQTEGQELSIPAISLSSTSPRTARVLMDLLATRVILNFGYAQVQGTGDGWPMAGAAGIRDRRAFERRLDPATVRRIEVGLAAHPAGGFEIHLHGSVVEAAGTSPNPDLAAVRSEAEVLVATLPPVAAPMPDDRMPAEGFAIEVRTLAYVEADGVMGLLKVLGYDTVEYRMTPGQNGYEDLYEPIRQGMWKLPTIVRLIEGIKTSIMDPAPAGSGMPSITQSGVPDMGGTYLHNVTTGEPLQRIMIVHDPANPEPLRRLLDLLDRQIDVPARQVVLEALVLEINRDQIQDLGLTFSFIDDSFGTQWERNALGQQTEFTIDFDKNRTADVFQAKIHAMVGNGDAKILSNPSVLVLDGRQARIQVGQRVPVITSTASANFVEQRVEYQTVGIVLNLRPRLNESGSEVTMQVETIVSAVDPTGTTTTETVSAPTFDNRLVQTYCRIADNTPFIVGGLISEDRREQIQQVPGLGSIPLLGSLFRRTSTQADKREVIIVLTPHVVPMNDKAFSRVIPKDSDAFDSFDKELFRNTYRVRRQDVFDLQFVAQSQPLAAIRKLANDSVEADPELRQAAPVASLLDGAIPGEDILVRRMLWETIRRTGFARHIDPARIIAFQSGPEGSESLQLARLIDLQAAMPKNADTLVLSYGGADEENTPTAKSATVEYASVSAAEYDQRLVQANVDPVGGGPRRPTILLSAAHPGGANLVDFLRSILVLKEVLRLNTSLPMRISEFYDGREIVYPTAEELTMNYHVVDAEAARLFYEVQQYYPAFQCAFDDGLRSIRKTLEPSVDLGPPPACLPQAPGPLIKLGAN